MAYPWYATQVTNSLFLLTVYQDLQDFLSHCFQKDPSKRKDAKFLRNHVWILKHENAKKEVRVLFIFASKS